MPLVDLKSDLTNLDFGFDRPNGGSSNEPYVPGSVFAFNVQTDDLINWSWTQNFWGRFGRQVGNLFRRAKYDKPLQERSIDTFFNIKGLNLSGKINLYASKDIFGKDFIIRGGPGGALGASVTDTFRLSRWFASTDGLIFTAKQNLLSLTSVRTQASGLTNGGVYLSFNTVAQAGVNAFGVHFNKQTKNFETFKDLFSPGSYTSNHYWDAIQKTNDNTGFNLTTSEDDDEVRSRARKLNRLFRLYKNKVILSNNDTNIRKYLGGPGSILGIGTTNIRFATDQFNSILRTGYNNNIRISDLDYFLGKNPINKNEKTIFTRLGLYEPISPTSNLPVSNSLRFRKLSSSGSYGDYVGYEPIRDDDNKFPAWAVSLSPNNNSYIFPVSTTGSDLNGSFITWDKSDIIGIPPVATNGLPGHNKAVDPSNIIGDFRQLLRNKTLTSNQAKAISSSGQIVNAPNYSDKNIEKRVNLGNPGGRGSTYDRQSYTNGYNNTGASGAESYDKITSGSIYPGNLDTTGHRNDLVKFAVRVYNVVTNTWVNLHFRAFLDSINDSYSADWDSVQYVGRGEKFYTYRGFDRKISLSWTVAAQSKKELIPMYKKLNYLASICAPNYTAQGYMAGNIASLTVGGYVFDQYGIINGFSYQMNEDNDTWEIGINDSFNNYGFDNETKELPHIIRVTGFNFTPIHNFVPQLVQNYTKNATEERYLSLANGNSIGSSLYKY